MYDYLWNLMADEKALQILSRYPSQRKDIMNPTVNNILDIISVSAGVLKGASTGDVQLGASIAESALRIARLAIQVHADNTGLPIAEVVAKLHDIPGPV